MLSGWIDRLVDRKLIALRLGSRATASAISAQIDGMLWISLADDRPLENAIPEIAAALDCFVLLSSGE